MFSPMMLGPLNGLLSVLFAAIAMCAVGYSLWRLHNGRSVPLFALVGALLLPLVFATWAGTFQHDQAWEWAIHHPDVRLRQTWLATMLSRTLATQLYAGLTVVGTGLALLIGAVALTVRGERPRWLTGALALGLGTLLVTVATIGIAQYPPAVIGARVGLYIVAVGITIAALVAAHRRGPGAQLATIAAVVVPLVVVGVDLATLSWVATDMFTHVAAVPPADKQALLLATVGLLDTLQGWSWLTLGLATALALLAPVTTSAKERPLAKATLVAIATIVLFAGIGLGSATHYIASFR